MIHGVSSTGRARSEVRQSHVRQQPTSEKNKQGSAAGPLGKPLFLPIVGSFIVIGLIFVSSQPSGSTSDGLALRGVSRHATANTPVNLEQQPRHNLLLNQRISASCSLPGFGRWCEVRPAFGKPFWMAVYAENDIVSGTICASGLWETNDAGHFGSPGNAVDIGGNVGYFTFLLLNAGWQVQTFEPLPRNLALIDATACQNPELAKNLTLHRIGLGRQEDECVFVSGHDNVGDGWVRCGIEGKQMRSGEVPVPSGYAMRGSFPVKRLDDILTTMHNTVKIDFVKMDVEGFECQVIKGGQSLFARRPRLIQSEVWNTLQGCTVKEYTDMFRSNYYSVSTQRDCNINDDYTGDGGVDLFMCDRLAGSARV